jgi:hypothetical protein
VDDRRHLQRAGVIPAGEAGRKNRSPRLQAGESDLPHLREPASAGDRTLRGHALSRAEARSHFETHTGFPRVNPWATVLTPASPTDSRTAPSPRTPRRLVPAANHSDRVAGVCDPGAGVSGGDDPLNATISSSSAPASLP